MKSNLVETFGILRLSELLGLRKELNHLYPGADRRA